LSKSLRIILLWLAVVGGGLFALIRYDATPAAAHTVLGHWPNQSSIIPENKRPIMIMAVHPQCSCTHASLNELQRMLPRMENKARVVVLLLGKSGNRYEDAVSQMHLEFLRDPSGSEARRFGLTTSGEVAVYSAGGDLLYTGGITGARAHEGDNSGEDAAIAAVTGERTAQKQAPVFGCELNSGAQSDPAKATY
jgi:hypothetical protein